LNKPFRLPSDKVPPADVGNEQTPFQDHVASARNAPNPRAGMLKVAQQFLSSDRFLGQPLQQLRFGSQDLALADGLEQPPPKDGPAPTPAELIGRLYGASANQLMHDAAFLDDRARLDDSLLALKLTGEQGIGDAGLLSRMRRAVSVIERAAGGDADSGALLRRPLRVADRLLPPAFDPPPVQTPPAPPEVDAGQGLLRKVAALEDAYSALANVRPHEIELAPGPPDGLIRPVAAPHAPSERRPKQPQAGTATRMLAGSAAVARMSSQVKASLAGLGIDLASSDLAEATQVVRDHLVSTSLELRPLLAPPATRVYQVGAQLLALKPSFALDIRLPSVTELLANSTIKPMSIGNLQVVKQELLGYETSDISHIENIMLGEEYERDTERQELSETITVTETEKTTSEERDSQSTDRNELPGEAQKQSQSSASSPTTQMASQGYGTLVENNQAGFGKEVTNKAVNSVVERVRQQRTQREQKIFIEKTQHKFSNIRGAANVRGIYQWLNKKYRARVLNYGKRLLFDVVISEPAAFLIDSLQKAQQPEAFNLIKPEPPQKLTTASIGGAISKALVPFSNSPRVFRRYEDLQPTDITPGNYLDYASRYGATGSIEPPPADYQTTLAWIDQGKENPVYRASKITLPKGYAAVKGFFQAPNWYGKDGTPQNGSAEIVVGPGYVGSVSAVISDDFKMNGEMGEIPVTLSAGAVEGFAIGVGVVSKNDTAYAQWQIKTYTAIMEGYKQRLAEYEDKLAQALAAVRTQMLLARNYAHDPSVEQNELKRAFIQLLMSQHWDKVNLPTPDPEVIPKDVPANQRWGAVVAFFERAFEWENMMYVYYPYFWGRPERWAELVLIQDSDPNFQAFLKAGAARVVVPARPGYEGALAHYQETGNIWFGEDMPDMFSDLYVSIVEEIRSRNAQPGQEVCVQEWDVILPTTLVMLRDDPSLPTWPSSMDCAQAPPDA
jgi:hypothetical protein